MKHRERGPHAGHVLLSAACLVCACTLAAAFADAAPHAQQGGAPFASRTASVQSDKPATAVPPIFVPGEQLTWEVSYLTVKLGSISTRVIAVDTIAGHQYARAECLIRTYRGVPFVTLNTLFQSTMNMSPASVSFGVREHIADTTYKYINYTFPKKRDVVFVSERVGSTPVPENYDTLTLDGKHWQDGLSLLFFARARARQSSTDHVPVLMYRSKATTTIRNRAGLESIDIDAVPYPVRTVKIDGETGFTGIFGLTGGFEGWFSDDAACIPIKAKMHVLIGSVKIELIKWKRPNWGPPRAS